MATAILSCDSCGESETELFYCETCSVATADAGSNSNEYEYLCEPCLGPHIRKCHLVRTSKGQEPLICSQHRRLHSEYCKNCDVTFCPKCLADHREHKIGNIDERAIEIKKEVFEMLTQLELDEKPLRKRKESISETKLCHEIEQNEIKKFWEVKIEELRQKGLKQIEENSEHLQKEVQKVADHVDNVVMLQKRSRDLLSCTNSHLITNFKEVKKGSANSGIVCKEALSTEFYAKAADLNNLQETAEECEKIMVGKLKTILSSKQKLEHYSTIGYDHQNYLLIVNEKNIQINRLKLLQSKKLRCVPVDQVDFEGKINSIYTVCDERYSCSIVILSYSGCAYTIDVTGHKSIEMTVIAFPSYDYIICPYCVYGIIDSIQWCYWSQREQVIKFSHNTSFEIKCSSIPMWKCVDFTHGNLCLVKENSDIILVDVNNCTFELVPFKTHQVESIDHVTLFDMQYLFIWCDKSLSYSLVGKYNRDWFVAETRKWTDASSVIQCNYIDCKLIPAVQNDSDFSDFKYTFSIFFKT